MSDEPRPLRPVRAPRLPYYPHHETCPACGHAGDRCISHVGIATAFFGLPDAKPTNQRTLDCGACGHSEQLPAAYQPQQPDFEPYAGDYVTWKRTWNGGAS